MSQDQFGESTRRAFLGTAAVATAATAVTLAASPTSETALAATSVSDARGAGSPPADQIKVAQSAASSNQPTKTEPTDGDWTKPAAMAIPKEGYFKLEQGRYGPIFPRTPANYGFTIIAKIKPGREETVREYGKTIEKAVGETPDVLAPLRLHYLRWVIFDVGSGPHFMYQGIFDTDFDKYLEDAIALFVKTGITTVFVNLEGWPDDWKTNAPAVIKFFREHQRPSFLEYGEYPYVTADEVKKALRVKSALSAMLDQMQ
jgi:hypothetical protein